MLELEQDIVNAIYKSYEDKDEFYLTRMGASGIGEPCERAVWYNWRGFTRTKFPGRILRLFETGYSQEERIIADLRRAGFEVWDKDVKGKQFSYHIADNHFVYKSDGVIKLVGESTCLEVKSCNQRGYDNLVKSESVKKTKPEHYDQIQIGMFLMNLKQGLYIAVCKNDESIYAEIVTEDLDRQEEILIKIDKMVESTIPPVGISVDGSAWGCKYCDHKPLCAGLAEPFRNCRTCQNASPVANGEWVCGLTGEVLDQEAQIKACDDYYRY